MLRLTGRIALVCMLVAVGWSTAAAQTPQPAQTVVVIGEVKTPGGKVWTPGMTVGRAVALAGGVTTVGRFPVIQIRRPIKGPDGTALAFATVKDLTDDTAVIPDDTVIVGRFSGELVGTVSADSGDVSAVTVEGEVNATGAKVWVDGMTVGQAISAAGGMTTKGKLGHIKRAIKDANGNILRYEQIKNLKPETPLLPGDVLVIARKWFGN